MVPEVKVLDFADFYILCKCSEVDSKIVPESGSLWVLFPRQDSAQIELRPDASKVPS